MFSRAYHYALGKIRVIVFSRKKDPRVTDRGVVIFNLQTKEVLIKSTDKDSKATIVGFNNIVQVRNALNEVLKIIDKQRARKNKKKK